MRHFDYSQLSKNYLVAKSVKEYESIWRKKRCIEELMSSKKPLFTTLIGMGPQRFAKIAVHAFDNVEDIAEEFGKRNNIRMEMWAMIYQHLQKHLTRHFALHSLPQLDLYKVVKYLTHEPSLAIEFEQPTFEVEVDKSMALRLDQSK